jgi:hypothetical protein
LAQLICQHGLADLVVLLLQRDDSQKEQKTDLYLPDKSLILKAYPI